MRLYVAVVLCLFILGFAQSMTLDYQMYTTVDTQRAQTLDVYVYLYPQSIAHNTVLWSSKEAQGDRLHFTWTYPQQYVEVRHDAQIQSALAFPRIHAESFPLQTVPDHLNLYTQPSDLIDITPDIIRKANELIVGIDDAFEVVHTLATWVEQNVEYSLDTIAAQATMPASWVLEQRTGVCDELTVLFIAMARSVGIPARYVSGIAYTTSDLFEQPWGNHAWAQVYLPQSGWIPVDVTYKQIGYVDATHIILAQARSPTEVQTQYTWLGAQAIQPQALTFSVEVVEQQSLRDSPIQLSIQHMPDTGFESYYPITVMLQNTIDTYMSVPLQLVVPQQIDIVMQPYYVLLKPQQQKEVTFWVYIPTLEQGYTYTFPFGIYTPFSNTTQAFIAHPGGSRITTLEQSSSSRQGYLAYSVACAYPPWVWNNTEVQVSCTLQNKGTRAVEQPFCINDKCTSFVSIGQQVTLQHMVSTQKENIMRVGDNISAFTWQVLPKADIHIAPVTTHTVRWKEKLSIPLSVQGYAQDIQLSLARRTYSIEQIAGQMITHLEVDTTQLRPGEHTYTLHVMFADPFERYITEVPITIIVQDAPWYAFVYRWFGL
ncbi:MAG: transglutaminase-like domain-containing protein [Candidatus Woesearchaeota archaeon]